MVFFSYHHCLGMDYIAEHKRPTIQGHKHPLKKNKKKEIFFFFFFFFFFACSFWGLSGGVFWENLVVFPSL